MIFEKTQKLFKIIFFFLENFVMRAQELQYRFKQRNKKTQERVRELMANASREVWACDPEDPHMTGYYFLILYYTNIIHSKVQTCAEKAPTLTFSDDIIRLF